jgi:hypothetical protein
MNTSGIFHIGDLVCRKREPYNRKRQIGRIVKIWHQEAAYGRKECDMAKVAWLGANKSTIGYTDPDRYASMRLDGLAKVEAVS